jgi:hypothetical protein
MLLVVVASLLTRLLRAAMSLVQDASLDWIGWPRTELKNVLQFAVLRELCVL